MSSQKRVRPLAETLTCFGVGDGWPCEDRRHSSFLYRMGGQQILVDCGDGLSTAFRASRESYEMLDAVFLSHMHSDHVGGFLMFVQGLWLERRRRPLTVYMPAEGIEPLRAMLNCAYLFDELIGFSLKFKALRVGRPVVVGNVTVTPHRTQHLRNLRQSFGWKYRQKFECFSFLLEAPGIRVGHSADIGEIQDLEVLLSRPLTHLVCELAHCELEDICGALKGRSVGRVSFVHLTDMLWRHPARTRRALKSALGGMAFEIAQEGRRRALR